MDLVTQMSTGSNPEQRTWAFQWPLWAGWKRLYHHWAQLFLLIRSWSVCCFPPVQTGCMHISKNAPSSPDGMWSSNPRVGLGGPHWSLPAQDILIPVMGWCQCSTQSQHLCLFSGELSNRTRATYWNKGNEFLLWMWSGTGASFPERMWNLHLWRDLKVDKTLGSPIWLALH